MTDAPPADAPPARCLNCGAPLAGPFCGQCGQEAARARLITTRLTFHDVLEDLVQFDGTFFRNLRQLALRPGLLTADFLAGRRARHLAPAKLYLLVNAVFFILVQWFDPVTADLVVDYVGPEAYHAARADVGLSEAAFGASVEERVATAMPTWLFVLVPALAFALALLHVGMRRPFAAHAAFAFHLLTFTLLALIPGTLAGGRPLGETLVSVALLGALPVWMALALRRVYGQHWLLVLLKTVGLWVALIVLVYVYLLVINVWAVAGA
jgi:hypothetical protein